MPEKELSSLPNMTPAIAKAFIAQAAVREHRRRQHVSAGSGADAGAGDGNLRQGVHSPEPEHSGRPEILLVPRIAKRMAHEFEEYRPWKSWAQFDKEIGKYVKTESGRARSAEDVRVHPDEPQHARRDEDIMTIPGMTPRMVHEFKEYRPWKTQGAVREGNRQVR